MSGNTGGLRNFAHGGGRHQSSEVPDVPETRSVEWLRMGANVNLAESRGRQKPAAQSKFRCLIIKIGSVSGFWRAALRITPHFCRLATPPGSKPGACRPFQLLPGLDSSGSALPWDSKVVTSFLDPVIAFVSAHPWLAYLTLFLAALLEAVPVVGALVPGSTIILALSALVPGGELNLWGVLAAAIAGALLGDGSAFWAGHRSQREILGAWPMSRYPGVMAQSEAFFHRWGTLAVFFARFVPPIRAFVPVTAGALGMPPCRSSASIFPRSFAWALAHVLPGVLAVSALHRICRPAASRARRQASVDAGRVRARRSSRSASGRSAAVRPGPGSAPVRDRHSARGAGSAGRAAIARRHARSIPPCAPWKTAPVHGRAAGRACAPAPQAHSRY